MRTVVFAVRSLIRQPGRTALAIVGIAAVGALLFDMLLLSRGLVVSFRDLLDSVGFDVRVTATDSPLPAGIRMKNATVAATAVAALPGVAEAVPMRSADADLLVPSGRSIGFGLMGIDPGTRRPWTIIQGEDLASGRSDAVIVLNETLMASAGLHLGSAVPVRTTCDANHVAASPQTFKVVGVAQFPFDDEAQNTAVTTRTALRAACGDDGDEADMLLVASTGGSSETVAAIKSARPDLFPVTNEQIVARMQTQGFTYFRQISAVLSTITLTFGFLLITVLLTVSVNQRLAEIAALRALGFSRRRAAADVLVQGVMVVGIGGLLALPLGAALSVWLDRILKQMPGIPAAMHFFVFEPRALVVHAALLGTTALLASAYPMWLVARLPIAATLRNEVVG